MFLGQQLRALQASVEVYSFYSGSAPYVEVFFYIIGNTTVDSTGDRSVEILYHFTDSSGAATGDKYNLNIIAGQGSEDFMDLRRHYLTPGTYIFSAIIRDRNSVGEILSFEKSITIREFSESANLGGLQILASANPTQDRDKWTKIGRRCIPMPLNYCHKDIDKFSVYTEFYNSDKILQDDFYLRFSVVTDLEKSDEAVLRSYKRVSPAAVIPVLIGFDVSALCTGKYFVVAEAFDRNDQLLDRAQVDLYRNNPEADSMLIRDFETYYAHSFTHALNDDSVAYALRALASKVSITEVQVLNDLVKRGEPDMQRRFIHRYWVEEAPADPEKAFREYMEVAETVDELFGSGFGYGFETDRGRIFMRYGAPDDQISVEDEPSAPPYEIWIYYDFPVTSQSNVKFLFYDPSLSNQFELLHSTAIGEIQNASWEQMLYRDAVTETDAGDFIDSKPVDDNFHRNAKRYFNDY